MLELRILNGLHRGAALALDDEALRIGADSQADVMLLDPDIADLHAVVTRGEAGWTLKKLDGEVLGLDGMPLRAPVALQAGDRFLLDGVWLGFDPVGSPWPRGLPSLPLYAFQPAAAAPGPAPAAPRRKGLATRWVAGLGLVGVTLGAWGTAASWALRQPDPVRPAAARAATVAKVDVSARPAAAAGPAAEAPSPAKLAELFRAELKARELMQRVDFAEGPDGWTLRGDLDADEQSRLERLLVKFEQTHKPGFDIRATVMPAINLLPFRIVQVSGGRNANIVTAGGDRLFLGDTLGGYKLVAVSGNRLTFDGPRKLDVVW
ncbi:FHA domain-containing protein [Chitinimonas koreensis]|uniref:FHA domain-containing protein n=1 Tax=Chitinimonas koreensis TaxID=356302 RepID=UPI00041C35F2|nr:FHA domain-containing protein [Chitinimonas koreensis]QNM97641.1 hypothetical protein H9L41_04895 [Chitinimonas koreensis]